MNRGQALFEADVERFIRWLLGIKTSDASSTDSTPPPAPNGETTPANPDPNANKPDPNAKKQDNKPKHDSKERTPQGAQNQREGISKRQAKLRKWGRGEEIQSIKKSMNDEKHQLKTLKTLKDAEEAFEHEP